MTTIRDIDTYITELCPRDLSEGWDNDGVMLCGCLDKEVKKVVLCLEIGLDAVKYAVSVGADVIITHHPFIFRAMPNIRGEKFSEIELLMKNNSSVLSCHTRYDKAAYGVNDILAKTLELKNVTDNGTFLRTGELECEMSGEQFAEHLRKTLGCGTMKTYFDKNAKIKKVSVCGGAGKSFLEEASQIADAYVSADFSHETFIDSKTLGTAVFDAGHYYTENPAVKKLGKVLSEKFGNVDFIFHDVGCPYFTI